MKYKLKKGVSLAGLQIVMRPVIKAAGKAYKKQKLAALWITCGSDGDHGISSLHPYGLALDFRLPPNPQVAAAEMRKELGCNYDIIVEKTHIHSEYDPK